MTKRLKIMIGPNRDQMEIAHVNNSSQPTIIDSELFVGRVLIKIRDFQGITHDGSPPIRNHVYFDGRSRKFDIQIEGRFKKREGVAPYTGEEVHFGSDFDHIVDFPKSAFNAGMRVARWIDPNVFYDLTPPSQRPFIMSPYLACMNTLCAWPCPNRLSDALVCLRQSDRDDDHNLTDETEDMVPMEQVDAAEIGATAGKKKIGRHPRRYWRYIGLKGDHGRIDAFLAKNRHLLAAPPVASQAHSTQPSESEQSNKEISSTDSEDDEFDNADALSCAPSSHATFSTAVEGCLEGKNLLNSGSSYRFSPRIFPRHQISFGAGMRDLYQDAETEANEREGEARASRMVEMMGEDETLPVQRLSPVQETSQNFNGGGLELEEGVKKSSSKVKHSLKKLKTALRKITPTLSSASPVTSNPQTSLASKRKSYSTILQSKSRLDSLDTPIKTTVSRASSRTIPKPVPRDSSQTLRNDSRSTETVKNLTRSSSLMPRPQSYYPPCTTPLDLRNEQDKLRSTSLDQTRATEDLLSSVSALRLQSILQSGILPSISQPAADSSPRQGSSRLSIVRSDRDKEDSTSQSSPSSHSRSNRTSDTSQSPARSKTDHQGSKLTEVSDYAEAKLSSNADAIEPTNVVCERPLSSPTLISEPASSPVTSSSSQSYLSEVADHSPQTQNTGDEASSDSTPNLTSTDLASTLMTTQFSSSPSQAEIDEAPELEDVEEGDLMFANMLKLAGDATSSNHDPVQDKLGLWRFKNPTTDILEDNTFVFLDKSVNVQKRRKHFSEGNGKHRKAFTYDPDVVYATSFFSPFMDFNTFDLAIGPVKINVAKIFGDMPVRYTLRSTRIDPSNDRQEEEIFVTISFELVDV